MRCSGFALAAVVGLSMLGAPAFADTVPPTPNKCFSMRDMENWKAPDARTIYIRVNINRFYRLDLAAPCQSLLQPNTHLVTKTRGSDQVCNGIDWDLAVSDTIGEPGRGFRQACIVKTQTPLTAAEVAAIPKKFKP
ncbi:MAG TPA: DUF6491 family protein [Rhizomicrobium sp.]|nr:DUF6491 family protein [Rhizomicrobium sp.]